MLKRVHISERWAKILAGFMVAGAIIAPAAGIMASSASQPRDDSPNSIIWGGCYTRSACVSAMQNGDGHGNSGANITKIYNYFGVTQSNLENSTVPVTVYKDGHVTINENADGFKSGDTIANGAESVGRQNIAGSTYISSIGVYERSTSVSFVANSITGFAYMPGGKLSYFVLNSCGNVGEAKPVTPPQPKPTPSPTPSATPSPSPTPSQTPVPTPVPSQSPLPTPSPSPTPSSIACVGMNVTQPDQSNPSIYQFQVVANMNGTPDITGYLWTVSTSSQPIMTDGNTPFIDQTITSGSETVNGQIETSEGTTPVSFACSGSVNVPNSPSVSPVPPTPIATPAVLGTSTQPLPSTGAESTLGGALGLTGIGFATRAYWRSRKSYADALRNKRKQ